MKLRISLLFALFSALFLPAQAQVSFTGPDYVQKFDTLAASGSAIPWSNNTTLPGWSLFDRNGVALTTYNTVNANGNAFISFGAGAATDRALGGVALQGGGAAIGAPAGYFAVALTNNTGHAIPVFNINYTGEQWRVGTSTVANTTYLEYGLGATYAAVTVWTRPSGASFHFTGPVATNGGVALALDGNAPANSIADLGGDITAAWASGETLWLRWVDINDAGNDHGLAIDNLTVHEGATGGGGGGDDGGGSGPLPDHVPFVVLQDSWATSASAINQGTNPELHISGGATPKETILKVNVTGVPGSVKDAVLRLYLTASQAGTQTQVYAANNNWSEATFDWNTRPASTTLLTEVANPDPAAPNTLNRYINYDVTPYISGSGTYTFIVRTTATAGVVYESREGPNPPRLEINYVTSSVAGDHNRLVTDVLAIGETYKARYSSPTDISDIGIFDVTKQPYGADPTGSTDSTLAIQRAVNEARDARVVAYFPAGTYLVSDTLSMVQGTVGYQIVPALGERWDARDFANNLAGPASGPRAKLLLAPNAPGFADRANPKVLARFWSRGQGNNGNSNQLNINYNQTLRNLDLDLNGAHGNVGAIGVDIGAAQGTSAYDFTIDAAQAFSGIHGAPGPGGSLTNVTVHGGKYGIYVRDLPIDPRPGQLGYSAVINRCALLGQEDLSIAWDGNGAMVLVGTRIEGRGISLGGASVTSGNLSVIDSIIRLTGGGSAVSGSRSVHMDNVYVENADFIANLNTVAPQVGNPAGWVRVKEYAGGVSLRQSGNWDTYRAAQTPPLPVHGITVVPGFVDGQRFETPIANIVAITAGQVPADLISRHELRETPGWDDADVVNVKTWAGLKATGDNATDDLPALQAAIDFAAITGRKIFLPKGDYRISAPLILRSTTTLFGVNKNTAIIKPLIGAPAFADAGNPQPLVTTPDDASATAFLSEVKLMQRMMDAGVYLLQWRTGAGSQFSNVNTDRRNVGPGVVMRFPLIRIEGNGGGKWLSLWVDSPAYQGAGYRHLLISGTRQPLAFYMFDPEADEDGIYNVEILGSSNISVFGSKLEGYHNTSIHVADSRNIRFFGFGGNAHPDAGEDRFLIENTEDFLFAMGSGQQSIPTAEFTVDPNLYNHLREVRAGEPDIIVPGWEQFTLYRRGQPGTTAPAVEIAASATQVMAGTTVLLTPTISGPGPYTYQWLRNGSPINGATSATLSLASAAVADSGSYTLTVSNVFGYTTSAPITLTVSPVAATVTLAGLTQAYDGTPRVVTAMTHPAGLNVLVTYDGAATAPVSPGSYTINALVVEPNYTGTASGTLIVTTTALVRHAPMLNGGLDGSVQVLLGENLVLNGNAWISGDLLVPGTPTVKLNGQSTTYGGAIDGTGSSSPSNYEVTLNGNAILSRLVRRTDPLTMPTVSAPPAPTGTRNVSINHASQGIGDPATLRNLTLNGNAGARAVPAGTYGNFVANGTSGFIFGEPGASVPAVYFLQNLQLNGNSQLQIVGPVRLVLAQGMSLNGDILSTGDPEWLTLAVASGGLSLNGNVIFQGSVLAPAGTVTINGNATLTGRVTSDRLTINGSGLLEPVTLAP